MSEIQRVRNVILNSDVCLSYRMRVILQGTEMCLRYIVKDMLKILRCVFEVQVGGIVTVYSDVFLM